MCRGEEEDNRIKAESLSEEVPLCRIVLMNVRSEADRVEDIASLSFLADFLSDGSDCRLPEKASPISVRS